MTTPTCTKALAILPYRRTEHGIRYLVRAEVTPCWSDRHVLSAIIGDSESDDIVEDVVRKLREKTGYAVMVDELIALGESYGGRSSDAVYGLFAVNLTGRDLGEDNLATWVGKEDLVAIKDPHVALMYLRLQDHLVDAFFAASSALGD